MNLKRKMTLKILVLFQFMSHRAMALMMKMVTLSLEALQYGWSIFISC
jgi:hypothetical protein